MKGEEGEPGEKTPTLSLQMDLPPVSPRARRASEAADALLNPVEKTLQYLEPQDVYGMRSRFESNLSFTPSFKELHV